jgi:thioredoxin-related protein
VKKLLTICCLLLATNVSAQEWFKDFDVASIQSSKEHKNIFLLFSGSDWCVPCMQLKSEILDSEMFKTAADELVLVNADFPRKTIKDKLIIVQNEGLAEKHNPNGIFPLVVIINPNGQKIATLQYDRETPERFIEKLDRVVQL